MSADLKSYLKTLSKFLFGGFVGSLLTAFMTSYWEDGREQRAALHTLDTVWHGVYLGGHRDAITEWLLAPEGGALRGLPPADYASALAIAFETNVSPNASLLAMGRFFRSVKICIEDERCDREHTLTAFGLSAREFHDLFGPLFRILDCEKGYSGTEDPLLFVARRADTVPTGPERCKEISG